MPLRDHFHPPFSTRYRWDSVHGLWPGLITMELNRVLPEMYSAGPTAHLGSIIEVDVGTFQTSPNDWSDEDTGGTGSSTAVAQAVWAPPQPTLAVEAEWSDVDDYEVKVYDTTRSMELVAAIEIVSPSNKDRPEHRRQFAAKCAAMLANRVSVIVLDVVTQRAANLYAEMLDAVGQRDPSLPQPPHPLYAVACRSRRVKRTRLLEAWYHPLAVGEPLPTLPLWLNDQSAIKLDFEPLYEETLRALRIK